MLNAGGLNLLIHHIVYECNARKIANAIKIDTEPELLPNISTHILRHTAFTQDHPKNTKPFKKIYMKSPPTLQFCHIRVMHLSLGYDKIKPESKIE